MIPGFLSLMSSCGVKCGLAGASILILMEFWRFLAGSWSWICYFTLYFLLIASLYGIIYGVRSSGLWLDFCSSVFWSAKWATWNSGEYMPLFLTVAQETENGFRDINYFMTPIYYFLIFLDVLCGTGNRKWFGGLTSLAASTWLMDLASMVQTVGSLMDLTHLGG